MKTGPILDKNEFGPFPFGIRPLPPRNPTMNVEPPLIFFLAGQDFIPGSFVPGALNVPSGSFDAPANGPDPLNFDPNEDLANSLVEVSLQQTMTFPLVNF